MRRMLLIALAGFLVITDGAVAQSAVTIPDTHALSLEAQANGHGYAVQVALPAGYADSDESYPAVYVLDANADFPLVVGISRRLQAEDDLAKYIVVGIAYQSRPGYYRRIDYTHTVAADLENSGGGSKFHRAVADEIVPLIDNAYRTDPGNRVLLGHSLGGLYAGYMAIEHPGLFHSYIISSPSVWYDNYSLVAKAKPQSVPTRVFISVGAEEGDHMKLSRDRLSTYLLENARSLTNKDVVLDGENHASAKFRAYADGLRWVFQ